MEKFVKQTLLFDFYGELLTEHQQQIYQDVVCNDLSCSEVAAEQGISRQGVYDLVRRCNLQLEEYESKLHLVERFLRIRDRVQDLRRIAGQTGGTGPEDRGEILRIADEILEEL